METRTAIHRVKCVGLRAKTFSLFLEIGTKNVIDPQKYDAFLIQYRKCETDDDKINFINKLKLLGYFFCFLCEKK